MSDERTERHPTDEPDGTRAYAASLRKPGESTGPGEDEADAAGETGRSGYDPGAVSGDTDVYRPD